MLENFHYKNIYLGKYTTMAGVALIAVAGYLMLTGQATLDSGAPLLLTGFGLLGSKDPEFKRPQDKDESKHEQDAIDK